MNQHDFFTCDRNGKGFRIRHGVVTTFEERTLFLKKRINHEADEKTPVPKAGTSRSTEVEWSPSSASGIKRKNRKEEDDKSENRSENSAKRNKNENDHTSKYIEDDRKTSGAESPFTNDLLLRTIFANLSVEDLKCCRLVNSLWNLEATKLLLKRDCLKAIKISNVGVEIHNTAEYKLPTALQDFRNILTNSKLFPLAYFSVNSDKLSNNGVKFYREIGHLVKSFCFQPTHDSSIDEDDITPGEVLALIATCFPNLTKLELVHAFEESTPELTMLAVEHVPDLLKLQTLEITSYFPADVVSLILKKAKTLQNIYLHTVGLFDISSDLEKLMKLGNVIPLLKNIHLQFFQYSLRIYKEVMKQKPRFSSVGTIDASTRGSVDPAKVEAILAAMFQHSSESLTEILNLKFLQDIPLKIFPVLPNVKRLGIQLRSLPSGVNLAQIFPNLRRIEMEFLHENDPEEILPESLSPLLSVRNLQVKWEHRFIPEFVVKSVCFLFPNVTTAKFCNPLSYPAYEYIWGLSKLQELHLEIGTKSRSVAAMDAVFSGLPVDLADKFLNLIQAEDFDLTDDEVEAARVNPSIADLKELRKLSLRLFDATVKEDDEENYNHNFGQKNVEVIFDPDDDDTALLVVDDKLILSCISKRFGFVLCPQLRSNVSVGFTQYTQLGAVANENEFHDDALLDLSHFLE